jgi:hypothetical protein
MSNSKKTTYQKRGPKRKKSLLSNPVFWVVAGVIVLAGAFFAYRKASQPGAAQASPVDVEVSGAPSLKVDQETIDFGDVPVTQMVTEPSSWPMLATNPCASPRNRISKSSRAADRLCRPSVRWSSSLANKPDLQ